MPDILHRVGIKAPISDVYGALATRDGLAGWWTKKTRGDGKLASVIQFGFEPHGFFDMKVIENEPGRRLL
jgi:uncharacterized protein YndB with AHSA1/START domain